MTSVFHRLSNKITVVLTVVVLLTVIIVRAVLVETVVKYVKSTFTFVPQWRDFEKVSSPPFICSRRHLELRTSGASSTFFFQKGRVLNPLVPYVASLYAGFVFQLVIHYSFNLYKIVF